MQLITHFTKKFSNKIFGDEDGDQENQQKKNKVNIHKIYNKSSDYVPQGSIKATQNPEENYYTQFGKVLNAQTIDYDQIKKLSWLGIPPLLRYTVWKLILDYQPCNKTNSEIQLKRKRDEYKLYVEQYYNLTNNDIEDVQEKKMLKTVLTDVPRTQPDYNLFKHQKIQDMLKRILFIWNIRHPACGYVQGMNEIVTPFIVVFMGGFIQIDEITFELPENIDELKQEQLDIIEADSYWCLTRVLDKIQDNYTNGQPGIRKSLEKINQIIEKMDPELHKHFKNEKVDYVQFAFRWVLCLLIRELPLRLVLRLFDCYLADNQGFQILHIYVCVALILRFSLKLKKMSFNEIIIFLQNMPTKDWHEEDIRILLQEAYVYMNLYEQSQGHIKVNVTNGWQQQNQLQFIHYIIVLQQTNFQF